MASSYETSCDYCGGPAHTNTDDGVTYCENPKCRKMDAKDVDYKPPVYRGG